jgi:hypothetical protein
MNINIIDYNVLNRIMGNEQSILMTKSSRKPSHLSDEYSLSINLKKPEILNTEEITRDDGVTRLMGDTAYDVHTTTIASPTKVDRIKENDQIEANYKGLGKYYPGKITLDRGDGTYDINYNDGEKEVKVFEKFIRPRDVYVAIKFEEGDKVEIDYRGKGKRYPGKIFRDLKNGMYDIDYDDGEKDTMVDEKLIYLIWRKSGQEQLSDSSSAILSSQEPAKQVVDLDIRSETDVVDSIVQSVLDQYIQRSLVGKKKYGTTLDRDDLSIGDWIQHTQEELMDATLYLEKLKITLAVKIMNTKP